MASISAFMFVRHVRAAPTTHLLHFRAGRLVRSGRGLAFWFLPLGASLVEVPLDDRELPLLVHGRSADFQDVVVQGTVTFRVTEPVVLAERIDFGIDPRTGAFLKDPLEKLALHVAERAQELAVSDLIRSPLRATLDHGADRIREKVHEGLAADERLAGMGIQIVSTRVTSVKPSAETERALQMPAREAIQQQADEATFARRALAVDKERAIQENELKNQIELAKREEQLIDQKGQNEKRRAIEARQAKLIEAEAAAEQLRLGSDAEAQGITVVEGARVDAERARMEIYKTLSSGALMGLAARELATNLHSIEHLTVSPDMLSPLLARLARAGTERLEAGSEGS